MNRSVVPLYLSLVFHEYNWIALPMPRQRHCKLARVGCHKVTNINETGALQKITKKTPTNSYDVINCMNQRICQVLKISTVEVCIN